jgi:ABC-type polysaccharide/polyol phosphate export permease
MDLQAVEKIAIVRTAVTFRLPGTLFLQNLIERRTLLFQLVRRDFEQRFIGSTIGWIWALIHPLVMLLSWTFVFNYCLKMEVPAGEGTKSYPLWLFAGMLPWLLFSEAVQRSASSLIEQTNLITRTVFPSEIIPVSVFLSSLVSHFLGIVLIVAAAGVLHNQISVFLVLLPLYVFLIGLLAVGLGWIVASLHVFLRDTAQVVAVVLLLWFWLTPIFITEDLFPPVMRPLVVANPFYYLVRGYRRVLLGGALPNAEDVAIVAACGAAVFVMGGLFFRHMKRGFADVL